MYLYSYMYIHIYIHSYIYIYIYIYTAADFVVHDSWRSAGDHRPKPALDFAFVVCAPCVIWVSRSEIWIILSVDFRLCTSFVRIRKKTSPCGG